MQRLLSRDMPDTMESRMLGLAALIMTVPRCVDRVDAVVVLPGQGEDERLRLATRLYDRHPNARRLIVAGSCRYERTWLLPTVDQMRSCHGLQRTDGIVIHPAADSTLEQSCQVMAEVQKLGVTSYALVAPPYHLTRACLSHIEAMCDNWVPIIPVPTNMSPFQVSPETGLAQASIIPGEAARIARYWELGGLASYEKALKYLEWLWQNFLLPGLAS